MQAWLEIDIEIIRKNVRLIRDYIGNGIDIIAVVKADGYGYGLEAVAKAIEEQVAMYAVMSLAEAERLRALSDKPILILGYLDSKELVDAIEADFVLSAYDKALIPFFERVAARLGKKAQIQVKVETGLHRLGMSVEEAADFLVSQRLFSHLQVTGIFSHLAQATDYQTSVDQLQILRSLLVAIQGRCPVVPIHLVSSYGLVNLREGYFDAVRVGTAMYGVEEIIPGLRPALSCKTTVMQVQPLKPGDRVGYNGRFVAAQVGQVGTLAIGYSDGLSQLFQGELAVIIQGRPVKVIGELSMNLVSVDVTALPLVKPGAEVVIIGSQTGDDGVAASQSLMALASQLKVRHNELTTHLGRVLPRFYLTGRQKENA